MSKFYKYRGNVNTDNEENTKLFERDLNNILNSEFYASPIAKLNDPHEFSYTIDKYFDRFENKRKLLRPIMGLNKNYKKGNLQNATRSLLDASSELCGIYSLSKNYNNDLMWAHYSNSHKGYCIEYELNDLSDLDLQFSGKEKHLHFNHKDKFVKVKYVNKIPDDFSIMDEYGKFIEFACTKHISWAYEEEYRIITSLFGLYNYNPKVLKSITFGLRCPSNIRDLIKAKLQTLDIPYFEIYKDRNSYQLKRRLFSQKKPKQKP